MGVIERVRAEQAARHQLRAYPVPRDLALRTDGTSGEGQFSPAKYGDYIATSNEIYSVIQLKAKAKAGAPLKLWRGDRKQPDEVTAGRARDLFDGVNPFWTFRRLRHMHEMSLGLWGKSLWAIEGGRAARPELWWVKPTKIRPVPHPTEYLAGFLYTTDYGEEIPFEVDEIFWDRLPNPLDEFEGLSPLAAARLGADVGHAAMLSNRHLFDNGLQVGGIVGPPKDATLTDDQMRDLELFFDRRFRGVDKAHRWGVLKFEATKVDMGVTPKDAEFLGALGVTLQQVCNAYGVPLPLMNALEHSTLANLETFERQLYEKTLIPEDDLFADEITEQILPRVERGAMWCSFDYSDVSTLKEDEDGVWMRAIDGFRSRLLTKNEARQLVHHDPVTDGDDFDSTPMLDFGRPPDDDDGDGPGEDGDERRRGARIVDYGSAEHLLYWQRLARAADNAEQRIGEVVRGLFRRQTDSVVDRLRERSARTAEGAATDPFDRNRWTQTFRVAVRPLLREIAAGSGVDAGDALDVDFAFDVDEPEVLRALERQAQRFAIDVNDTTWRRLKRELEAGVSAGEGIPALEDRVRKTMGTRIRSNAEAIARTETTAAANLGTTEAWRQSGVVTHKSWVTALDGRERDSHRAAHGQTVPLAADFTVGIGRGPAPGAINRAEEVVNCRCRLAAVVSGAEVPRAGKAVGTTIADLVELRDAIAALQAEERTVVVNLPEPPAPPKRKATVLERDESGRVVREVEQILDDDG